MAGVRRVEPFRFSPRYEGDEARMLDEVMSAFSGPLPEECRSLHMNPMCLKDHETVDSVAFNTQPTGLYANKS
jgi:hypothetical protein